MEASLYNQKGSEVGKIAVPDTLFSVKWNPVLVRETVDALRSSRRRATAHAKDRGDVSGGGKKPWRQKGTGRARHGSTRSPIWVGGGVSHGPSNERNFAKKVNKTVRRKALAAVLSQKLKEGEVVFLDEISLKEAKTREAVSMLQAFGKGTGLPVAKKGGRTLVLIPESNQDIIRAVRNIPFVDVIEARNVNVEQALVPKYVIITKDAVAKITA